MRSLRVVVVLLAIVGVSSVASASLFVEDFDSYAAGSQMHGQGGWKGWDNDPTRTAPASSVQANSGSISAAIGGNADLVHEFDFAGGNLELSAMQYIPGGGTSVPIKWGEWVQLKFVIDLDNNTVHEYYDGTLLSAHSWDDTGHGTLQCIDLFANNASSIYYDDITVVPEPATLSLLCLGGLALIRKRRNS